VLVVGSPAGAARELARLARAEAARGCGVACSPDAAACLSGLRPGHRLSIDLARKAPLCAAESTPGAAEFPQSTNI